MRRHLYQSRRGRSPWAVTLLVASCSFAGPATAAQYPLPPPGEDVVGDVQVVKSKYEDTLIDIARAHDLGYEEIKLANSKVDPWLPGNGTDVVLPTRFILPEAPREGVVINVAEMRLYYYPKPKVGERPQVITYPLGVGRMDWKTPIGLTKVMRKQKDPIWYPPDTIQKEHAENGDILPPMVPAGPDNPLGNYALYLGIKGYLIHGTNQPYGIGMQVTHGCVRLYPEDIESLFQAVPVGTDVQLVNQPYKVGHHNGRLYVEVHPPLEGDAAFDPALLKRAIDLLVGAKGTEPVDWKAAEILAEQPSGMPERLPLPGEVQMAPASPPADGQPAGSDATAVAVGTSTPVAAEAPVQAASVETKEQAAVSVDSNTVLNAPASPTPAAVPATTPAAPAESGAPVLQEIPVADEPTKAEVAPQPAEGTQAAAPTTAGNQPAPVAKADSSPEASAGAPVLQELSSDTQVMKSPEAAKVEGKASVSSATLATKAAAPVAPADQDKQKAAAKPQNSASKTAAPKTPNPPEGRAWQLGPH